MTLALKLPADGFAEYDRGELELTILMPCLNEAETIARMHREGARGLSAPASPARS